MFRLLASSGHQQSLHRQYVTSTVYRCMASKWKAPRFFSWKWFLYAWIWLQFLELNEEKILTLHFYHVHLMYIYNSSILMDGRACISSGYPNLHYDDVIMTTMASQITSLTVVNSTVYSDADQRKHQTPASLAFVWGSHRDRWIPRTKGQLRGKCFHLMTSSWITIFHNQCMDFNELSMIIAYPYPMASLVELWNLHSIIRILIPSFRDQ